MTLLVRRCQKERPSVLSSDDSLWPSDTDLATCDAALAVLAPARYAPSDRLRAALTMPFEEGLNVEREQFQRLALRCKTIQAGFADAIYRRDETTGALLYPTMNDIWVLPVAAVGIA